MFESLKNIEKSDVLAHLVDRSEYWTSVAQCTPNELVSQIARAYTDITKMFGHLRTVGDLQEYCRQNLHPAVDAWNVNAGRGIVARDILYFISEGKGLLDLDAFSALSQIRRDKLVERVRAEVGHTQTLSEIESQRNAFYAKQKEDEQIEQLIISNSNTCIHPDSKLPVNMESWIRMNIPERNRIIDFNRERVQKTLAPPTPIKRKERPSKTHGDYLARLLVEKEQRSKQ